MGFQARAPWRPDPAWWPENAGRVEWVCSVSDCLVETPPGFINRWDFNRACCYSTEAEALATIPRERAREFRLFAYWLVLTPNLPGEGGLDLDAVFPAGAPLPEDPPELSGFEFLGYDVVGLSGPKSYGFDHSPLSCNGLMKSFPVSRSCLFDRLEDAVEAARQWNSGALPPEGQPEPGHYWVVRVAAGGRTLLR